MTKILSLICMIICIQNTAFARNTFVGNGGSAGDMELLVTEKQLLQTLDSIASNTDVENYCVCQPIFQNHSECNPLSELSKKQKNYCSSQLQQVALKAKILLERKDVRFNWTREDIYVRDNGQTTTVDAVANAQTRTVTINQNRFFKLPPTRRLFLLAHEIFHLVPIEKKLVGDSGSIGPFVGQQGLRKLLNSMAAGTVMMASKQGVLKKYRRSLRRRKAYKKTWVDGSIIFSGDTEENGSVYAQDSYAGLGIKYRKYFGKLGFNLGLDFQSSNDRLLTSIDVDEVNYIIGAGLSYRFMPFNNPLSFWGQTFINVDGSVEYLSSHLKASDEHTSLSSSTDSVGWSAEVKYYLPLRPFWLHVGLGVRKHEYEHTSFNLKKNSLQSLVKIGVSYAF